MARAALYRTIWRWHFYAGLFVLPFILMLATTGSIYLFKPQIDRWEERAYRGLDPAGAVSPDRQLAAATTAFPGARFDHYRLPERAGDAALIELSLPDGAQREVFVSPQGKVLGALDPERRISKTVSRIHGTLLLGEWGDRLVELAASWTIVMILTGLILWWPRPFAQAGMLWPRFDRCGRPLLKDLHRVTGFWIAGLVLAMLASGLPWAGTWGSALKWVRTEVGWVKGPQDWKIGAEGRHAGHHHGGMAMPTDMPMPMASAGPPLSAFVAKAEAERMAFPVLVLPPHAPQTFGGFTGDVWTVKSEAQDRPLDRQVTYNPATGAEIARKGFADEHPIDRIVNYGVAWHEGQLFGLANQLIGLATALALVAASLFGVLMWLKRRPAGELAAPPRAERPLPRWTLAAIAALALLLPLFGVSALILASLEWAIRHVTRRGRLV